MPADDEDRRQWLADRFRHRIQPLADRYRDLVIRTYGPERGAAIRYIEAFEISEYGAPLDALGLDASVPVPAGRFFDDFAVYPEGVG